MAETSVPAPSAGWDKADQQAREAGGGRFIPLKNDKDFVVGVFVGSPEAEETYFNEATNKSETYTAKHKEQGLRVNVKFKLNFFVLSSKLADGSFPEKTMGILTLNPKGMQDAYDKIKRHGQDGHVYEVKRIGVKGDNRTAYNVSPQPGNAFYLSAADKEILDKTEPFDLGMTFGEKEDASTDMHSHDKKNGAPATNGAPAAAAKPAAPPAPAFITDEQKALLMQLLKTLPAELTPKFIEMFPVKGSDGKPKIGLLPADKVESAFNWIKAQQYRIEQERKAAEEKAKAAAAKPQDAGDEFFQ